jgi:formylglycine-generating enzyme required for sulfatase activity
MDDHSVIDPPCGPGRGILDNGFGWIRGIRFPCIQPGCWSGREPGDYARVCVAFSRERARRQGCMPDVLQFDARAACAGAGATQGVGQRSVSNQMTPARVALTWLAVIWSIGASPAAAQACNGVQVEIGASEQRCLKPGSGQPFKDCRDCPEMVVVPAGSFVMGATPDEEVASPREDQVRVAIARPFAVGRFAVTRGEFAGFVAATGHKTDGDCYRIAEPKREVERNWRSPGFAQDDRHPAVCINWNDARAYAAWISSLTGKNYRLLSEAEREYVTRAGSVTPFWWGTTISTGQANYNGNVTHGGGAKGEWRKATVAVEHFSSNPWGSTMCTAMSGNGRRIAGMKKMPVIRGTAAQGQPGIAAFALCAALPSTIFCTRFARPGAKGRLPAAA